MIYTKGMIKNQESESDKKNIGTQIQIKLSKNGFIEFKSILYGVF